MTFCLGFLCILVVISLASSFGQSKAMTCRVVVGAQESFLCTMFGHQARSDHTNRKNMYSLWVPTISVFFQLNSTLGWFKIAGWKIQNVNRCFRDWKGIGISTATLDCGHVCEACTAILSRFGDRCASTVVFPSFCYIELWWYGGILTWRISWITPGFLAVTVDSLRIAS